MRKVFVLLALTAMVTAGCSDKLKAIIMAKTAITIVELGTNTAREVIATIATAKRAECSAKACMGQGLTPAGTAKSNPEWDKCLVKDHTQDSTFQKCYEPTRKMVEATDKLWPQMAQAQKTAAVVVKSVEAGKGDLKAMGEAVKSSVCLAVKLTTWIPEKSRKKLDLFLTLVGTYACDGSVSHMSPGRQLYVLKLFLKLTKDLG